MSPLPFYSGYAPMAIRLATSAHSARVEKLTGRINRRLAELIEEDRQPAELYEPIRYVLESGGKRIRPLFVLLAGEIFEVPIEESMPAALATELFHNFTLVHDDIMDQSLERRGRPTVHERWTVSTAILGGDFLLGGTYHQLVGLPKARLATVLRVFHRTMEKLCEGQALDKMFEERSEVSVEEYLEMIDRKTGALFETSLELGPVLAGASAETRRVMRAAGVHIGRAFQIQDDLLDVTATDDRWGKSIGEDLIEGKKTYLLVRALERAEGEMLDWFRKIVVDGGLPSEQVPEARRRLEALGVVEDTRQVILHHYREALDPLMNVSSHQSVKILQELIGSMRSRMR
jgi:geranylgeranyl diphosphate synthase type II